MDHTLPVTRRILSPTDISQFLRKERCERYLRLRMYERESGRKFLYDFDVAPQEIPPILSRSGEAFEKGIVAKLSPLFSVTDYAATPLQDKQRRLPDNQRFQEVATALPPGKSIVIAQPRLEMPLGTFQIRGDADLVLLTRDTENHLSVLVVDVKSSIAAKVEHRLQVAFYALMMEPLLPEGTTIQTAILYRGPALGGTAEETEELKRDRAAMQKVFGLCEGYLEEILDQETYRGEVESLVSGENPVAERVAKKDAKDLVFALGLKCDSCLYNQYCMKKAHMDDDLALLPYLTVREKKALQRGGIKTMHELAMLKDLTEADGTSVLVATETAKPILRALATTTIGARIDELILRAKRRAKLQTLSYIPNKGHSSLPVSSPDLHPNLIRVYIEAQHDFVQDRAYLVSALVVANADGVPVRRRHIAHISDGPPDSPTKEAELFAAWIVDTLKAIVELAEGGEAPIHLIFWNDYGQKTLLEALARNLPPMIQAAPALYDFMTQIAAYDSPMATFLAEEIRQHKNYEPVCPSMQRIASLLRFNWTDPQTQERYHEVFRESIFDSTGKLDDGTGYARRSRHSSQIPLEYAYAAWKELPAPSASKDDPYEAFRDVTKDQLLGFARRRLDAIEHIANDIKPSDIIRKASFSLPDLAQFVDRAAHLAAAIREFLMIERHTYLANWRTVRSMAPEQRAVIGETLLLSYHDADQEDGGAHMRECRERAALYDSWKAANPDKKQRDKATKAATDWTLDGQTIRLRVETEGMDADLETLLGMMTTKDGDWLVCYPRWTDFGQEKPYTPTPKQLLYGMRVEQLRQNIQRNEAGQAISATVDVTPRLLSGGKSDGYTFAAPERLFEDAAVYTLDENPTDYMGRRMKNLADDLCNAEQAGSASAHSFYDRVSSKDLTTPALWPTQAVAGQARFLSGLTALYNAGIAYEFEPSKRAYIGEHGGDPLLLVQGPPGTGKSFSTGFAVLARIQGAMAANIPQRVFLSCKTHSATDVLLKGVRDAQETLAEWRKQAPALFAEYFEPRLLTVPTFRLDRDEEGKPPEGDYSCIAGTPSALAKMAQNVLPKGDSFGSDLCDLLVLDEASQMSLPEALLASLPLTQGGRVVVVGDPRQMPPIVQHAWDNEPRRTFQIYPTYLSLFDFLLELKPPIIRFEESFRLHQTLAEFLREEIYQQDGIPYHSRKTKTLDPQPDDNPLVTAALAPDYPLVVIVHDEAESQTRNAFEEKLLGPLLRSLADAHGLDARHGFGVVVPHRAQRIALRLAHPQLCVLDDNGQIVLAAVDTVERYQGDEREVVIISATESDPDYIQASAGFLLDPRRLTVALSRAKRKMILVASRSIFEYASVDDIAFRNAQIWKNLLRRACRTKLYESTIEERNVVVYGCPVTAEVFVSK